MFVREIPGDDWPEKNTFWDIYFGFFVQLAKLYLVIYHFAIQIKWTVLCLLPLKDIRKVNMTACLHKV